ncbi:hypothetical protein V5799_023290 [Amblyomma americanum]|uniref:M13 family peptidase n=1 Tax=Amblyomma americanum TaxID=6943 RepID=A0AAQ4FHY7_AMBAM
MSTSPDKKASDDVRGARPRSLSRSSARDEQLLRSLRAALGPDVPANRLVDRDTRFRIVKVEPKWRRGRDAKLPPAAAPVATTPRPAPRAIPGTSAPHLTPVSAWPTLKQPQRGKSAGAQAARSSEASRAAQSTAAVRPKKKQKPLLEPRKETSPAVRPPPDREDAAQASALPPSSGTATTRHSAARQEGLEPVAEESAAEAVVSETAERARWSTSIATAQDAADNKAEPPPPFAPATPNDTRATQERSEGESKPEPALISPRGVARDSEGCVRRPGKVEVKRTIPLRSNLSVSRQNVEGRNPKFGSHAALGANNLAAAETGTSSSADPVPAPRKRMSVVLPGVVGGSPSHAAGLVLESSRYSIRDLGAGQAAGSPSKHSSGSDTPFTGALVNAIEAGSQACLPVATRDDWEPLTGLSTVGARTAVSNATTSTQRAFQTVLDATDCGQQFEEKAAMSWRQTPEICFSPCLLGSRISNAESNEMLLQRAGVVPVGKAAGESLLATASLTSLSRSSRDLAWPRRLTAISRPTLKRGAAVSKKTARRAARLESGQTWHSVDYEETLAPTAGHCRGSSDASRVAPKEAERSSDEFHSAGSAQLPPLSQTPERFFSVDRADVSTLRKAFRTCTSSEKGDVHLDSPAATGRKVAAQDVQESSVACLDNGSPSMTNRQHASSHSERATRPSLSLKSSGRGRKASSSSKDAVPVALPSRDTPPRDDRRGTADEGGNAHSFSLDVRARNVSREAGTSAVPPGNVNNNRADVSTDTTFYTASEMQKADFEKRLSAVKAAREGSTCESAKKLEKTLFVRPAIEECAYVNSAKMDFLAGGKASSSSEEFLTAPRLTKKLDRKLDAWPASVARNSPRPHRSLSQAAVGERDRTHERLDSSDEDAAPANMRANDTDSKALPKAQDRDQRFCGMFNKPPSEESLLWDSDLGGGVCARPPLRRRVSPGRNLPRLDDQTAQNLLTDFFTAGRRSRAPSEIIGSPWSTRPVLLLAPSPEEGSAHVLVVPTAARTYLGTEERAALSGTPDAMAALGTSTASVPSFLTARSLSEPNFVALGPSPLRDSRSLSGSLVVYPGSVDSCSGEYPGASGRPTDFLQKTTEEKRLPKVAPKKKRPKQTVILKPTVAQTDMTSRQHAEEVARVSASQSPGGTGMEVSMTTRSHAKELCLSMLAVSICVLGLVLLAKSAGGKLGDMRILTSESNASENLERADNDSVPPRTSAAFTVVPSFVVCNLTRCVEDGAYIASSLSWDRDPCVDFYDFACAKWLEERAASASITGGVSASVAEDIERDMEQRVAHLLSSTRAPEFAPLRRLHDACADVNFINAAGWAPLGELLRLCGLPYWPYDEISTLSPWKAAARALQYTGAEAFMSVDVTSHPVRANRSISALDRPRLVLRSADLAEPDVHWLEDTADTIMTAFRERPRHLARECVAVAVQIARLTYSRDALSDVRLYRVVHLAPFPRLLEFLATLFANVSSVHASSEVLLRAEGFLRDLLDLADEHKSRALLNYVGLRVAVHSSAFLPDAAGLQAVHGRVLFPHEPTGGYIPRDRLCARQAAATMPFLFTYAVRLLIGGEATVRALTAALETMRHHLAEHLSKLSLADYQTRLQLVKILKDTRLHLIGPPVVANASRALAHARALPATGDDVPLLWFARVTAHVTQLRLMRLSRYVWRGGVFDRDCSSDLQANAVFMPPLFLNASGTLDRSLLALQAPHLGARFARCLLLMLLAGVSNRGNRELVTRGWWSDSSKSALEALRRCLARPVPGAGDDGAVTDKAPLSRVADALAVAPALSAFTHGVQTLAGSARQFRLPLLEGLSTAQLFFDYYALSRCRRQRRRRGSRRDVAADDDVDAALRQSAAFHEAFECARGRPMNADAPCALWT